MTAETTTDIAIISRIHDAFNRRDLDAIAAELTDDVVFHCPDVEGLPPVFEGREAVRGLYETMMRLGPTIEHHNAEALAGYVVGIGTATFDVDGEKRSLRLVDVCQLRDGKLAERWPLVDRPDEFERILADFAARSANA